MTIHITELTGGQYGQGPSLAEWQAAVSQIHCGDITHL